MVSRNYFAFVAYLLLDFPSLLHRQIILLFFVYSVVGIAQGLNNASLDIPFSIRRAFDKFLFALLFLNNGILSQLSKMIIIQQRDAKDPGALRVNFLRH